MGWWEDNFGTPAPSANSYNPSPRPTSVYTPTYSPTVPSSPPPSPQSNPSPSTNTPDYSNFNYPQSTVPVRGWGEGMGLNVGWNGTAPTINGIPLPAGSFSNINGVTYANPQFLNQLLPQQQNPNKELEALMRELMKERQKPQQGWTPAPYYPQNFMGMGWDEAQTRARAQLDPLYADLLRTTMSDFDSRMAAGNIQGPYAEKLRTQQQNELMTKQSSGIAQLAQQLLGQSADEALKREQMYLEQWKAENQFGMEADRLNQSSQNSGTDDMVDILKFLMNKETSDTSTEYNQALKRTEMFGKVQAGDDKILGIPVGTPIWDVVQKTQQVKPSSGGQNFDQLFRVWQYTGVAPPGLESMGVKAGTPYKENDPNVVKAQMELEEKKKQQEYQTKVLAGTQKYQQLYGLDARTGEAAWDAIENSPSLEASLADLNSKRQVLQSLGVNVAKLEQIIRERMKSSGGTVPQGGSATGAYMGGDINLPEYLKMLAPGGSYDYWKR